MTCPNCATLIKFPDGMQVWIDRHISIYTLLDGDRYYINHHKKIAIKEE